MTDTTIHAEHHHDTDSIDVFGFWIYILTDCILFATLFATFAVLHNNSYGAVGLKQLISLPYVFKETMALLASSFTYGLAMLALYKQKSKQVAFWLVITFLFGATFVGMELHEFIRMYMEGHSWMVSAQLSAFFALVGTHGFHVSMGLLWMLAMIIRLFKNGIGKGDKRRLTYLGLFWHFLDIVWIFVFTVVYLMGVL